MRSRTEDVRQEADQIAQAVYDNPEDERGRGYDSMARAFADFKKRHRGHAVAELIAAYARVTVVKAPERYRDAAGVPNVVKFHDVDEKFTFSHQTFLCPDSGPAKAHHLLRGDNDDFSLECSVRDSINNAHAAIAYQDVLTAAHVGDEDWLKRASRAYAEPTAFSPQTGYRTVLLFLVFCRPSPF